MRLTDLAVDEPLEHPREVRAVDAEHRGARAHERVERHDREVGVLVRHALHHVDLGAHADDRARRRVLDEVEDALGGADEVGERHDVVRALGVHDHHAVGVLGAEAATCSGRKRWCTEQWPFHSRKVALLDLAVLEAAELLVRVPHLHRVGGVAHVDRGVAPEVLVGEEQHLVALGQRPLEDGAGVGRRCTPRRRARPRRP